MAKRFEQLELLLELWPEPELLDELVRWLPDATFKRFFDDMDVPTDVADDILEEARHEDEAAAVLAAEIGPEITTELLALEHETNGQVKYKVLWQSCLGTGGLRGDQGTFDTLDLALDRTDYLKDFDKGSKTWIQEVEVK